MAYGGREASDFLFLYRRWKLEYQNLGDEPVFIDGLHRIIDPDKIVSVYQIDGYNQEEYHEYAQDPPYLIVNTHSAARLAVYFDPAVLAFRSIKCTYIHCRVYSI